MKVYFFYSRHEVSLNSMIAVPRLVAEHCSIFSNAGHKVVLIACKVSKVNDNVEVILVKTNKFVNTSLLGKIRRKFNLNRPYYFQYHSLKNKISEIEYGAIVICPQSSELYRLGRLRPDLKLIAWLHNFPIISPFKLSQYLNKAIAAVAPSEALYKSLYESLLPYGFSPAFVKINYFLNQSFLSEENNAIIPGNSDEVNILFLGGSFPYKGLRIIQLALSGIHFNHKVILQIGGTDITGEVELPNNVKFKYLGRLNRLEVRDVIQNSNIGVVPSCWFENSPTALIEMMSSNLLIIASNTGGIPEILGNEGILIENPNSLIEWREALVKYATPNISSEKLEIKSMKRILEIFNNNSILNEWIDLFTSLSNLK